MNSIDVMVDLETTGTKTGCCILSIGACTFDEKEKFYAKILHSSCLEANLADSIGTMNWWGKQSPKARMEAFSGTTPLLEVLGGFADFLRRLESQYGQVFIWGNGADFDLPILGVAYSAVGMENPWKPFNGRCYRTLKNLHKDIKADEFIGEKHNALDDAVFQARHALKILRNKKQQELFVEVQQRQQVIAVNLPA